MDIILLGSPGTGKGTQAKMIVGKWGVPHISTGDILRAAVREGTVLGAQAKEYLDLGKLVPDRVVIGIIEERLNQSDAGKGFVLDGFPRTIEQAKALDEILAGLGRAVDHVLCLDVDDEELVRRLTGRRICRECGTSFHTIFNPSRKGKACDSCGGELYRRADDSEETIRRRFGVYQEQTTPLIGFFNDRGLLRKIDGSGDPERTFSLIVKALTR